MTDKTPNAADPEQVKDRKRTAKQQADLQAADLRVLLAMPEFRRYAWRHMTDTCGLLQSSASPNGSVQSINIGMQDVARKLWAEIEAIDPLVIPQMMVEHHKANQQ